MEFDERRGCAVLYSPDDPATCTRRALSNGLNEWVRFPGRAARFRTSLNVMFPTVENIFKTDRHTTFYLSCGPDTGPPVIFLHGWPELSLSWRHQLACLGSLGFRAIAPDMRGYGRSSVYARHEDYALECSVQDMLELIDGLGYAQAIWVGHDWGSPVVWSLASHHPERCLGVANLCVPYLAAGFAPSNLIPLVDRTVYPVDEYPVGQWDYQLFYAERFSEASSAFEANVLNTVKALFRKGRPDSTGKPSRTASIRRAGGWFGAAQQAPDVPLDTDVLSVTELTSTPRHSGAPAFLGRTPGT